VLVAAVVLGLVVVVLGTVALLGTVVVVLGLVVALGSVVVVIGLVTGGEGDEPEPLPEGTPSPRATISSVAAAAINQWLFSPMCSTQTEFGGCGYIRRDNLARARDSSPQAIY
jgi:hypothetical protein